MGEIQEKNSVKNFLKAMLVVYIGSLFLAACFAPFIMDFVAWVDGHWSSKVTQYLCRKPVGVYIDRLRIMGSVFGVIFLYNKYRDIFKKPALELKSEKPFLYKSFCMMFGFGFLLAAIVVMGQLQEGSVVFRAELTWGGVAFLVLQLLVASFIVSFLEEYFFRGLLFKNLALWVGPPLGCLMASVIFAALHFNGRSVDLISQSPMARSFETAGYMFLGPIVQWDWIPFLNLTLLGIILTMLYQMGKTLKLPIAFHAGIAFGALLAKKLMIDTGTGMGAWGSLRLLDSFYGIFLFIFTLCGFLFLQNKGKIFKTQSKG